MKPSTGSMRSFFSAPHLLLLCAAICGTNTIFGSEADAPEQFKLIDIKGEWTTTRIFKDSEGELGEQPLHWAKPTDFLNGTLHLRLEITKKPSDLEVMSMICLWQNGNETCTDIDSSKSLRFSEPGVYYGTFPAPGPGDDIDGNADWKRPKAEHAGKLFFRGDGNADKVLMQWWVHDAEGEWKVLRHNPENGIHAQIDYGPEALKHIPIAYRLEIYVVAKGAVFKAPSHWKN